MRNRRPLMSCSETKSSAHRSFGSNGTCIGVLLPSARFAATPLARHRKINGRHSPNQRRARASATSCTASDRRAGGRDSAPSCAGSRSLSTPAAHSFMAGSEASDSFSHGSGRRHFLSADPSGTILNSMPLLRSHQQVCAVACSPSHRRELPRIALQTSTLGPSP
jgi:hypothetical protein